MERHVYRQTVVLSVISLLSLSLSIQSIPSLLDYLQIRYGFSLCCDFRKSNILRKSLESNFQENSKSKQT